MSVFGHLSDIKAPINSIGDGLKAIARAMEKHGTTYNVIVNVPSDLDRDQIAEQVVEAMNRIETRKQAQRARFGPM